MTKLREHIGIQHVQLNYLNYVILHFYSCFFFEFILCWCYSIFILLTCFVGFPFIEVMEDEDLFLQSNNEFEDDIPRLEVCILLALLFSNLFLTYNFCLVRHENFKLGHTELKFTCIFRLLFIETWVIHSRCSSA